MWTAINLFGRRLLAGLRESRRQRAERIIAPYRQPALDETRPPTVDQAGSKNIPRPGNKATARRASAQMRVSPGRSTASPRAHALPQAAEK